MAAVQLHFPFRFRNTSKNYTHIVATRASSSSASSNLPISTPKSSDFGRLISTLKSESLNFALSGTLALAVSFSGIYSSSIYLFVIQISNSFPEGNATYTTTFYKNLTLSKLCKCKYLTSSFDEGYRTKFHDHHLKPA